MSLSPNLTIMIRAAEKAARSLSRDFGEVEKLQVSMKGPGDFVSKADKRSEEIILENLVKDRPEWGYIGEEGANKVGADARYRWIIDPLDGTTNFLHGLPHWCITIALEKDDEIVAAIMMDPLRNEIFRAEKGAGAFMNNTRLRVSGRRELKDALIVYGLIGQRAKQFDLAAQDLGRITRACDDYRRSGSAALDLAYVAAGRYDAYAERNTAKWDIAAGMLLVREATGVVSNMTMKPVDFAVGEILVANATLHPKLAKLLGQ